MSKQNNTLLCDFYELTMANGYFELGKRAGKMAVRILTEGAKPADVAASIFQSVVTQTISGLACGRPIRGHVAFLGGPLQYLPQLRERAEQSADPRIRQLFSSLDHLLTLAFAPKETQESDVQRRADRLSAQCDMLRIALDDELSRSAALKSETEGMVTLIKEYIALPCAERSAHTETFCQQAAQRLSAVECALMAGNP